MQTFLPYPDFEKSMACLDYRRLGKQRIETKQLLSAMQMSADPDGPKPKGWVNHPAKKMWDGHYEALAVYHDASILAWLSRGYKNNMPFLAKPGRHLLPSWFGDEDFHAAHRSNLLRKDPVWYGQFGWTEPDDLPYIWPVP